jgi:hypothetical protein
MNRSDIAWGHGKCRPGFTVFETMAALGVLSMALVLIVQLGSWSRLQRAETAARHEAVEAAANVLERARAQPWESLTSQWAAAQKLSDDFGHRSLGASLDVQVSTYASQLKRVTVTIRFTDVNGSARRPVQLVGWFAARSGSATGAKP